MTHIMVPDGVLPWWLSVAGWLIATGLLGVTLRRLRTVTSSRMVPLVAVMTALMVVVMSFELVPIGYELHLTVLTGLVIGPWYGAIAALLFNVLRAFIGDGAFTNIGLNTAVTWIEIALGAAFWAALRPPAQQGRPAVAAGAATFAGLLLSTLVFIGVMGISTVEPGELVETGAYDVAAVGFKESPFGGGLLSIHLSEPERAAGHDDSHGDATRESAGFARFALAALILGAIGALLEATLTGAIVAYIARVRPGLLDLHPTPARVRPASVSVASSQG
ncbi:MAG: energy-coupling factor ABC transporter permease [Chloroflexi bacterium]|nr:energy-coupling factor ABC transporter permease [Chloroflexota bacterium]